MDDGHAPGTGAPNHWEMEFIKRRLDRLASLVAPARAVSLLGLPQAADVEGQLRAEGVESLLAAQRIPLRPGLPRSAGAGAPAVIWLGDAPEDLDALRRLPPARLLLWPRPERVAEARALLDGWRGPPPILCSPDGGADGAHALPDPAHALWGLLDHHPEGDGTLELPDHGWDGMLPPARLAMLRRFGDPGRAPLSGALGLRLRRLARRRVLEAARRRVVAHAAVSGTRVGGSVLAALLGRGFRAAPAAGPEGAARIAAYWADWRAAVAVR